MLKLDPDFGTGFEPSDIRTPDDIPTNYNGMESRVLHTKLRGNRPAGSGEEDF